MEIVERSKEHFSQKIRAMSYRIVLDDEVQGCMDEAMRRYAQKQS